VNKRLFSHGKIVATPGAIKTLEEVGLNPGTFLKRHQSGDWGDCDADDKLENDLSVREGLRIFSVYHISADRKIWIITEADRSSTCILLPDEY